MWRLPCPRPPVYSKEPGCTHSQPLMSLPLMLPLTHFFPFQIGGTNFVAPPTAAVPANLGAPIGSGLSDLFDLTSGVGTLSGSYVAPKAVLAPSHEGQGAGGVRHLHPPGGLHLCGPAAHKALQIMTDFVIQFNCNSLFMPLGDGTTMDLSLSKWSTK
nr:AP-1 complex subunit beta-1-like [Aotus nancymaae]